MTLIAFRDAYSRDAGNLSFGEQVTTGLTAGTPTPWFSAVPKNGKPNVLGMVFKCVYALTATGAITPQAGTDVLDPLLQYGQIDVSGASGAAGRSQNLTRQFIEFVYAAFTNTAFTIAALPTFASTGAATVTVSFFIPLGGPAAAVRLKLPAAILGAAGSAGVPAYPYATAATITISYTSITSYIVSTDFTGVAAFREEKTPVLGTGMQSLMNFIPKDVAPDASFQLGETGGSAGTITQVLVQDITGVNEVTATDTDALQLGAAAYAPVAGATYTTTAGFVMALDGKQFSIFEENFAASNAHYIGFAQCSNGAETISNIEPQPTAATPAVQNTGTVTASGQVAAKNAGTSATGRGRSSAGSGQRYPGRRARG